MINLLLRCLYSAGASRNNQSDMSFAAHDIWKFQTKLRPTEALAQPPEFPSIRTVANNNSLMPVRQRRIRADMLQSYYNCILKTELFDVACCETGHLALSLLL